MWNDAHCVRGCYEPNLTEVFWMFQNVDRAAGRKRWKCSAAATSWLEDPFPPSSTTLNWIRRWWRYAPRESSGKPRPCSGQPAGSESGSGLQLLRNGKGWTVSRRISATPIRITWPRFTFRFRVTWNTEAASFYSWAGSVWVTPCSGALRGWKNGNSGSPRPTRKEQHSVASNPESASVSGLSVFHPRSPLFSFARSLVRSFVYLFARSFISRLGCVNAWVTGSRMLWIRRVPTGTMENRLNVNVVVVGRLFV